MQGGTAINLPMDGIAHDDYGDNISLKNDEYCELTVIYNAWKNYDADYYGFCHYRRFFCFNERVTKPYLVFSKLNKNTAEKLFLSDKQIRKLVFENDIIVPYPENIGSTVQRSYYISKYHHSEDLDLFLDLMKKHYPFLVNSAQRYLSQNKQFFCNMFIMKKRLFFEYCEILFPLLEEFDKRKKIHGSYQSDRTDGYLAERFFGIFLCYITEKYSNLKIKYVARIDTECSLKKRVCYYILPPESKRRLFVKKIIRRI